MTLKNARRRLEYLGYELERVSGAGYKARKIGTLNWTSYSCLETLVTVLGGSLARIGV